MSITLEVPSNTLVVHYDDTPRTRQEARDFNLMFVRADLHHRLMALFGADKPSPQPADNMTFNDMLSDLLDHAESAKAESEER